MYTEINELDRITIGVREWAVGTAIAQEKMGDTIDTSLEYAAKLEKYVLGGIKNKEVKT